MKFDGHSANSLWCHWKLLRKKNAEICARVESLSKLEHKLIESLGRETFFLYSDGSCKHGCGSAGFVVQNSDLVEICRRGAFLGKGMTSSEAEYGALTVFDGMCRHGN